MASYTNLASLAGLQVGDVVTYTVAQSINLKKYKVKVELYGKTETLTVSSTSWTSNGGYTTFTLDPKSLSNQYFYWTSDYGSSLMYDKNQAATSRTAYYRIGVAGDAGKYGDKNPGTGIVGQGGGTTGEDGFARSNYASAATGGSQTAGGTGGVNSGGSSSTKAGSAGSFGVGGLGGQETNSSYTNGGNGGNGWYGGGGGAASWFMGYPYEAYQGGGGSGFAIGQSTTIYPSGYMGDNSSDISALTAAVSNATLTQGGSSESSAKMVLTILEIPKSFPKYYNGSAWIDTEWKRWNGSTWEDIEVKYYNGTSWV